MRQELIRILRFLAFQDIQIDPEPLVSEEPGPAADAVPSEKSENIGSSTRSCAFFVANANFIFQGPYQS